MGTTVAEASKLIKPEVAAAVVTTLSFPLGLALAVVVFLVIQHLLDHRDPKLRVVPRPSTDLLLPFELEDEL